MQRYISSELTHFVGKGLAEEDQYTLLLKILSEGFLSHPPHSRNESGNLSVNTKANLSTNQMFSPQVVCFCDIPLEDLPLHMGKYSRFGLAFGKSFVLSKGGSPVFYIPTSSKVKRTRKLSPIEVREKFEPQEYSNLFEEEVDMGKYFDEMIQEYHALLTFSDRLFSQTSSNQDIPDQVARLWGLDRFLAFHILSFIKFFDPALADGDPNNFYFEREWRVFGNIDFRVTDLTRILLPQEYSKKFRTDFPNYYGQLNFSRAT